MIIQRWQSVLLLVSAAVMAWFTFLSLGQVTLADYTFNFTSLGFQSEGIPTDGSQELEIKTWYFFMLSLTTVVLILIDIFLFKNLRLQKKVCLVSLLFVVASGAVGGCLGYSCIQGGYMGWSSVALAPFIAIIGLICAYNRMCADERLLKSADRLR